MNAAQSVATQALRVAPLAVFRDIAVVPTRSIRHRIPCGGPVWPDFDRQTGLRHCRSGRPVDRPPPPPAGPCPRIAEPCVWGGYLETSFGHLVAEHVPRLPFALAERPDDLYLFTAHPRDDAATLPPHVWDVLAWLGLRRERVCVVTAPVVAAELRAGPQAEMLWQSAPAPGYLAELGRIAARNGLEPEPRPVLYVTRAGMTTRGQGGHLGEGYLVALLRALGVAVIDPAALPVRAQLAAYAGAAHLVFAEGSALHGRQLLGYIDQTIHVLLRRRASRIGRKMIAARCARLVYHETAGDMLRPGSAPRVDIACTLYDRDALFAAFAAAGVDLAPHWDDDAWRAAAAADLAGWLLRHRPAGRALHRIITSLAWAGIPLPEAALAPRTSA
ncbi:MAG: glycosyltransferase family 61 protein [Rhodobacteraceae bacterium]|nr:glycosyltransferase family 61 protein [Paracoccaceae bacterium]